MSRILELASQGFSYLILFGATVMLGWGVLGFLEYLTGLAPLMPLQNPTFPSGTQFVHWLLITLSGGTMLVGYFSRWRYTPIAMMILFASLATLCAVETFDFMVNPGRYGAFVRECIYYVIMSIYLVRSRRMRDRFGTITIVGPQEVGGWLKQSNQSPGRATSSNFN